jgi:hypothetical protein
MVGFVFDQNESKKGSLAKHPVTCFFAEKEDPFFFAKHKTSKFSNPPKEGSKDKEQEEKKSLA